MRCLSPGYERVWRLGVLWSLWALFGACGASPPLPPQREAASQSPVADAVAAVFGPGSEASWRGLRSRLTLSVRPVQGMLTGRLSVRAAPSPLSVALPRVWADGQPRSGHVRELKASCDGVELPLEAASGGVLKIVHQGCQEIEVRYRLDPRRQAPNALMRARLDGREGALIYGQGALLVPELDEPVGVEVVTSPRWSVASTWEPLGEVSEAAEEVRWRYVAQEPGHLQDSALVVGDLRHQEASLADGRTLRVVLSGVLPLDDARWLASVVRLADAQRAWLPQGWRWPRGTGQVTVMVLGRGDHLLSEGAGRRGGVVLEVGQRAAPVESLELLAHELFHVVNGHLLVHKPESELDTLWFKEGVTTYAALRSMVASGLVDEAWFRRRLGELVTHYFENPGATRWTLARQVARYWSDAAAQRLPYDKGALLALVIDAQLGSDAQGELATMRWLRRLLVETAARGEAYELETLRVALEAEGLEASVGFQGFWARYVLGAEVLPVKRALRRLGWSLKTETEAAPYYGVTLGQDARGSFVSFVDPQGPASSSGLRPGDRLAQPTQLPGVMDAPAVLRVRRGSGVTRVVVRPERGQRQVYRVTLKDRSGQSE